MRERGGTKRRRKVAEHICYRWKHFQGLPQQVHYQELNVGVQYVVSERLTCPASRENLPPPTISVTGGKEPRGMLSTVVPTASPTAKPNRLPLNLSLSSIEAAMAQERVREERGGPFVGGVNHARI